MSRILTEKHVIELIRKFSGKKAKVVANESYTNRETRNRTD